MTTPDDPAAPPLPVLYVNLDRAVERRRHTEDQIARAFPPGACTVHRVPGVDGGALDRDRLLMTPYTRYILADRSKACSHVQLESWGAVGCLLSHIRCWEWLLAHPEHPHCLVLEDDACLPDGFHARVLNGPTVRRLRDQSFHGGWDLLMLGYFEGHGLYPVAGAAAGPGHHPLMTLRPGGTFFGAHAYLVSRHGAAVLREHAFPMELQVDGYMVVLQQIGWLRLYLVDAVHQCIGGTERGISHGFKVDMVCSRLCSRLLSPGLAPDGSWRHRALALWLALALVAALAIVVLVVWVVRRRGPDYPPQPGGRGRGDP